MAREKRVAPKEASAKSKPALKIASKQVTKPHEAKATTKRSKNDNEKQKSYVRPRKEGDYMERNVHKQNFNKLAERHDRRCGYLQLKEDLPLLEVTRAISKMIEGSIQAGQYVPLLKMINSLKEYLKNAPEVTLIKYTNVPATIQKTRELVVSLMENQEKQFDLLAPQ